MLSVMRPRSSFSSALCAALLAIAITPATPRAQDAERFDTAVSLGPLGNRVRARDTAPLPLATMAWIGLAVMADGSTMRVGPHKETLKLTVVALRERQDDAGRLAIDGAVASRMEHLLGALLLLRAAECSTYRLLVPNATRALAAAETAMRDPKVRPTAEEVALFAMLAHEVAEAKFVPRDAAPALREAAHTALTTLPAGKSRRGDAARHLASLALGDAHPPELTIAVCWPANLHADPLHTWLAATALRFTDAHTRDTQFAQLKNLAALRIAEGPSTGSWPEVPGVDAATSTALFAAALAMANS